MAVSYIVRHHITHPRHLERYFRWRDDEHIPSLQEAFPALEQVRAFRAEKDAKYFLMFYDLRGDWNDATKAAVAQIRRSWDYFAPDLRDFSGVPYQLIWESGDGDRSDHSRPLIVERLTVLPEKEAAWNRWSEDILWPEHLRDLPADAVYRYRALTGDPVWYVQVQEFPDDAAMRRSIKESEPNTRPQYWQSLAEWMPYLENLSRWVFLPSVAERELAALTTEAAAH